MESILQCSKEDLIIYQDFNKSNPNAKLLSVIERMKNIWLCSSQPSSTLTVTSKCKTTECISSKQCRLYIPVSSKRAGAAQIQYASSKYRCCCCLFLIGWLLPPLPEAIHIIQTCLQFHTSNCLFSLTQKERIHLLSKKRHNLFIHVCELEILDYLTLSNNFYFS